MDFTLLIGSVQMVLAAIQLKLDHFSKPVKISNSTNNQDRYAMDEFYDTGEAIRTLEHALAETVAFIGQSGHRDPNPRLAHLWDDASRSIRQLRDGAELSDLAFQKGLYWRDPSFFLDRNTSRLHFISIENVLIQLRRLGSKYEKLQQKLL